MENKRNITVFGATGEVERAYIDLRDIADIAFTALIVTSIIHTLLAYAESQRRGETAFVSNDVPEILQRPARTVENFLKEYIQWFQ